MSLKWAIGVTTVPSRFPDLFPQTLSELKKAGFEKPRVFVDGVDDGRFGKFFPDCKDRVTFRGERIRTYGNWIMGVWELLLREPECDRYAMFQDDIVSCISVREYLDRVELKPKTYWNLYTFTASNECIIEGKSPGWYEAGLLNSDPPTELWQTGRGAIGLVFSREGIMDLLSSRHVVERPLHCDGWKKVDGGIVTAMNKAGYREMIHAPSLLQHVGDMSTMGNRRHKSAISFPGRDFDAYSLLNPSTS
jgi:hypothetical protein